MKFIKILKGEIKTKKEVWCGLCNEWEHLEHVRKEGKP